MGIVLAGCVIAIVRLKKQLDKKTILFWGEENGMTVLRNSEGEEITRL
jgi:hypothetical protein